MKNKLISLIVGSLILLGFVSESPIEKMILTYERYLKELPQEKIYLHLNRPYYSTGETIWFKAYLVAGPLHEPSPLSHVIHIELINQSKEIVHRLKVYTDQGSVGSQIQLSDSLSTGNYVVRAYTQWMENFNSDFFFHQSIKIFNSNSIVKNEKPENTISLKFFPEGGTLIYGLRSKLAFKALGKDGLGRKVKGTIIDSAGNTVSNFESNFLGMGYCMIIPERGKSYKALLDSYSAEIDLPTASENGIVMSLTNALNQNEIVTRIQTNKPGEPKILYLVAQTRGLVCYATQISSSNPISFIKIPKSYFPTGVSQFTLYDENAMPLAERLVFVNENKSLKILVESDKKVYKPREKITLTIDVKDADNTPVVSDLSLSVCDNQQILLDEHQENILSYLYLSSDLRGHIESPGYYFNPANDNRNEDLDVLLLTQGWRRFQPDTQFPKASLEVERGIVISGRLIDKFNQKPISDGKVTYLATFPLADIKIVRTNDNGEFKVPPIIYFDSTQAILQGETKKGNKWVKFEIDSVNDSPSFSFPISGFQSSLADYQRAFIKKTQELKQIDEAYNFDERTRILDAVEITGKNETEIYQPVRLYGTGPTSVKISGVQSLENLQHPLQLLQGRVAGVRVSGAGLDWTVSIRGIGSINAGTSPLILVNNIPVDISYLNQLAVKDIDSYDVWKGPETALFGSVGANGVIAFYTKGGSFTFKPREGVIQLKQTGFQTPRQFYAPEYDVQKPEHVKPDRRMTLFWAPIIRTDSTGKATVSFYNHDLESSITGIIEGISSSGVPVLGSIKYSIKK